MIAQSLLALALAAAPLPAAASHYHAVPAAKPAEARLILRGLIWRCGETQCSADEGTSRPAIVCAVLARSVGPLTAFSAGGRWFDSGQLEKCNARAR